MDPIYRVDFPSIGSLHQLETHGRHCHLWVIDDVRVWAVNRPCAAWIVADYSASVGA